MLNANAAAINGNSMLTLQTLGTKHANQATNMRYALRVHPDWFVVGVAGGCASENYGIGEHGDHGIRPTCSVDPTKQHIY
jgi:hypothetical protein